MNVKQLREFLAQFPDDLQVVLTTEPDGDGYYWKLETGFFIPQDVEPKEDDDPNLGDFVATEPSQYSIKVLTIYP